MHGLGNDFIVFDGTRQKIDLTPNTIKNLANRHTGIGFDQCLIIENSLDENFDFFYKIYNANGSEVGQCGNGARCLARFIQKYGLSNKSNISIKTQTAQMRLKINPDDTVTVDMGTPILNHKEIEHIVLDNQTYSFFTIDVGNPHAVLLTDDIQNAPVQSVGAQLSIHPYFPNECNIGFMQIMNSSTIKLRVYERGCGETSACGSGAVAAASIGMLYYNLTESVAVQVPGGELVIQWPNRNNSVFLTGPATFVYEGTISI